MKKFLISLLLFSSLLTAQTDRKEFIFNNYIDTKDISIANMHYRIYLQQYNGTTMFIVNITKDSIETCLLKYQLHQVNR